MRTSTARRTVRTGRAMVAALAVVAVALLSLALGSTASASGAGANASSAGVSEAAAPAQPEGTQVRSLSFDTAFSTHVFTAFVRGGTTLTVSTADCCVIGDHWGVFLIKQGAVPTGTSNQVASRCSTGTSSFTGPTSIGSPGNPVNGVTIKIYLAHCTGVTQFPAGMDVKFSYNGPTMNLTQRSV